MSRLEELGERIDSRHAQIGVIGLGYVGLPLVLIQSREGKELATRGVLGFSPLGRTIRTTRLGICCQIWMAVSS